MRGRPISKAKKSRKYQTPDGIEVKDELRADVFREAPSVSMSQGVSSATRTKRAAITKNLMTTARKNQLMTGAKRARIGISGFQNDEKGRQRKEGGHDRSKNRKIVTNQRAVSIKGKSLVVPSE